MRIFDNFWPILIEYLVRNKLKVSEGKGHTVGLKIRSIVTELSRVRSRLHNRYVTQMT